MKELKYFVEDRRVTHTVLLIDNQNKLRFVESAY